MSRSAARAERAGDRLRERLASLEQVATLAGVPGRLPREAADRVSGTVAHARDRLRHGTAHTVIALAGATGSGKSSLFNALVGAELAPVGVRRPTTSSTRAAVFDPSDTLTADASGLLDWLSVSQRHVVASAQADELAGLVLLDLPDHDSTAAEHRAEVDRLVEVVDAFVWVVDPQKYADLALHEQYLRRFAGHAAVTLVVLNQVDLVPEGARGALLDDLGRLLHEDGLTGVRVVGASTVTHEGLPELRRELVARVAERRAVVARLDADIDWLAEQLAPAVGDRDPTPVSATSGRTLARTFSGAAGSDAVAAAVGAAHRHRASAATGWPPTRWVRRLRPDPLRRLGLDRAPRDRAPRDRDADAAQPEVISRTSRAAPSAVAEASVSTAVRSLVDEVATGLPEPWQLRLSEVANARRDDVADGLDRAVGSVQLPTGRPRWWSGVSLLQWVLAGVMAGGLAWLLVIGVVAWFGLPDLPTPEIGVVPWPTLLALGGAILGLLVAAAARLAAGVGARRRAAAARRALDRAAAATAEELVVAPVDAELADLAELRRVVRDLAPR